MVGVTLKGRQVEWGLLHVREGPVVEARFLRFARGVDPQSGLCGAWAHVGYVVHGLCGAWVMWCMGYVVRGLCGAWVMWCMGYVVHGLCGAWAHVSLQGKRT